MKAITAGKIVGAVTLGMCMLAVSASANTITVDTGAVSLGGSTVSGEAVFTTGAGVLNITLRNLEADPTSVGQCISGLSFVLSSGQTSGTLASSSGKERTIASNGTFTDGSTVATGWALNNLFLNLLGTGTAPEHTIVGGPGTGNLYHGNSSIVGNGPHNPFLAGDVTFTIDITGLTANSTIIGTMFQFGTSPGSDVTTGRVPPVPDGGMTLALLGTSLCGLGLFARRRK